MTAEAIKFEGGKKRRDGLKVILMAGLSVQAWAFLMGVGIIVLNVTR
ncbi:hypothetical protein [Asticcacaulis sp. AND118]|nr:hypothetical protein [Asticcacaulis sp. AND118]UDF04493.1 hypothetical protein LH365_05505 [Asticcacaulis sp. AND118]